MEFLNFKSLLPGFVLITFVLGTASTSPAFAINCKNYARQATNQQRENIRRKCGFTGPRWHMNTGNHALWCTFANNKHRLRELRVRRNMLKNRCLTIINEPQKIKIIPEPRKAVRKKTKSRNKADAKLRYCQNNARQAVALEKKIERLCINYHYNVTYQGNMAACMSWPEWNRRKKGQKGLQVLRDAIKKCDRR